MEYCAKQPLMSKKYLKSSKDVQGNGFPLQSLESYAKLTYSWLFLIEWVESKIYITVQSTSSNLVKVAENGQKLVDVNRERPLMTATEKYARNCQADQPLVLLQCFKKEAMLDFKIIFNQLDTLIKTGAALLCSKIDT